MRRLPLILLPVLFTIAAPACRADGPFAGVWTANVCPRGVAAEPGKCSQFVLELYQKQGKVCGSHVFATAGAGMVDETPNPGAPSVSGDAADDTATVNVASSRSKAPGGVQAELKLARGTLQWKRLDKPGRDDLLPPAAQFTRSRHKSLMAPVFAQQLAAACSLVAIPEEPKPVEQPHTSPSAPDAQPDPEPRNDS